MKSGLQFGRKIWVNWGDATWILTMPVSCTWKTRTTWTSFTHVQ